MLIAIRPDAYYLKDPATRFEVEKLVEERNRDELHSRLGDSKQ